MLTGGRRLLAAAIVALIAALAACGSSTTSTSAPGSVTTSDAQSGGSGTATPTAVSPTVLDPFLFPEQDTPLSKATQQLQQIWTPYKVSIIPSRHTLETMPQVRTVANLTGGALSDADAQSFLVAEYRDNAFSGWAEKF